MFRIRKKCESRCNIKTGIRLFENECYIYILDELFKSKLEKENAKHGIKLKSNQMI